MIFSLIGTPQTKSIFNLSRLLPGPFCTLQLAQLGADVLKIEHPGGGDEARIDWTYDEAHWRLLGVTGGAESPAQIQDPPA